MGLLVYVFNYLFVSAYLSFIYGSVLVYLFDYLSVSVYLTFLCLSVYGEKNRGRQVDREINRRSNVVKEKKDEEKD